MTTSQLTDTLAQKSYSIVQSFICVVIPELWRRIAVQRYKCKQSYLFCFNSTMASIDLYLIRHGIAIARTASIPDEDRPLTDEGYSKTKKVAKKLHQMGIRFDLILTSPLKRARQTAEILKTIGLSHHLEESTSLAPDGDMTNWLNWLETWRTNGKTQLALVGHQPDLGNWAETLVWGEIREKLVIKKAGVMGLSLPETGSPVGQSQLFWLTPPKFLVH